MYQNVDWDKVKTLAGELAAGFETVKDRAGNELVRDRVTVRTLRDGARERFQSVCHDAHGDMLPDDWRYSMIEEAAEALSECDSADEYERRVDEAEPPIYNVDLLAYIGSHGARFNGYADEALTEYGASISGGFMGICSMAWILEFREVAESIKSGLESMAEEAEAEA